MKYLFHFLLFLVPESIAFSQDCNTQAANKPSTTEIARDSYLDHGMFDNRKPSLLDNTVMKSNLGKAESWIKNRLTGFTGAKLLYQNSYFFDPIDFSAEQNDTHNNSKDFYRITGIKGYYYGSMRFYAYYCYDNKLPIHTEGESGSFVQIIFNNVFASELCSDVGVFTINGKSAFKKLEKIRSSGRIDYYELRAKTNGEELYTSKKDIILLRNSDIPVFIPISRKEYLEQMLKDIELYKTKTRELKTSIYTSRKKEFEHEISVYKATDKTYTTEKEAKQRKWFNEDVNPEKLAKELKKIEDETNSSKKLISEYQGKPQEWLNKGFSSFYPWSFESYAPAGVQKYLDGLDLFAESSEDLTRTEVVSINPNYYNKAVSSDLPQLICVVVLKQKYPHMLKVADIIKQPGTLAPLETMLSSGK